MKCSRQDATQPSKLLTTRSIRRGGLLALTLSWLAYVVLPVGVHALTTISQGYLTTEKASVGSIVSLKDNSIDTVNLAASDNVDSLFGVVINTGNSLLSLGTAEKNQIQVATSGVIQVLVSDVNGKIEPGDQITASPLKGVGMRATNSVKVIGISQGTLKTGTKETFTDKNKQKHEVLLSQVPVLVNVSYYYKQPEKTIFPSVIQNVANAFAGRKVSAVPIIISLIIFVVALIMVVSIIYSTIRSSIISVGRNPMSQSAIYRNLIQISALVLTILGATVIAMYMVLTRF